MAYTDLTGTTTRADGKIGFYKGTAAGTSRLRRKSTGEYIDIAPFVAYPTTQFLVDGDSMSALNAGMAANETWAEHLRASLDPAIWGDFYNSAIGGQDIAQMLANVTAEIDNKKSGSWTRHVVSCLMGINSIYHYAQGGLNASQIYESTRTDLVKYHVGRVNKGFITIAYTLTATQNPLYPALHAVMDQARVLLNDWIRLNWQSVLRAGILVDLDATDLGGFDGVLNEELFLTDRIHLNNAGRIKQSGYIREQLPNLPLTDPSILIVDQNTAGLITVLSAFSSLVYGPSAWTTYGSLPGLSSSETGAFVQLTISTTRIKLRAPKSSNGAAFTVEIDGVEVPGGTTYNATDTISSLIWDSGELLPISHTIRFTKVGTDTNQRLYFDALVCNVSAPVALDNRHLSFQKLPDASAFLDETDTTKYRSVAQTGGSTANTGTKFLQVGATMVTLCTARQFRLYAPKFSGGGILKMKITRMSDSVVVFNEDFNQENATTVQAGAPTLYHAQLDTGLMTETLYQLELIAVTANCSFDAVETNQETIRFPAPYAIEDTATYWTTEAGTWTTGTSAATYRGDGKASVSSAVGSKKSRLLPFGTKRVKLYTAKFSTGGIINMKVIDIDTSATVYSGDFNQLNATTIKSGEIPGTGWALDSGILPDGSFKLEFTHVSGSAVSFDAVEVE